MPVRKIRLGDILQRQTTGTSVEDEAVYPLLGVRSFGRGAFDAGELLGAETSYTKLFACTAGQIVYPKLMAWEGAFDVVPEELSGRYVSPEFCLFTVDRSCALPAFVGEFLRSETFMSQVTLGATGTNVRRRRLQPSQLEAIEIPLPSVDEQEEISGRLLRIKNALAATGSGVMGTTRAVESLISRYLKTKWSDSLLPNFLLKDHVDVVRGVTLRQMPESQVLAIGQASVRWHGVDITRGKPIDQAWEATVPTTKRSRTGSILLNSTGEGTLGRACKVADGMDGFVLDSKVLQLTPLNSMVSSDYLVSWLWSPFGQQAMNETKGATTTKQTELGLHRVLRLPIPIIDLRSQESFIADIDLMRSVMGDLNGKMQRRANVAAAIPNSLRNELFSNLA